MILLLLFPSLSTSNSSNYFNYTPADICWLLSSKYIDYLFFIYSYFYLSISSFIITDSPLLWEIVSVFICYFLNLAQITLEIDYNLWLNPLTLIVILSKAIFIVSKVYSIYLINPSFNILKFYECCSRILIKDNFYCLWDIN
jgi:hypothetical protein